MPYICPLFTTAPLGNSLKYLKDLTLAGSHFMAL